MRSGLVDEKGFNAFRKEVVMLSRLDHINIVGFVGYSMDPFLLIVMDFVSGVERWSASSAVADISAHS